MAARFQGTVVKWNDQRGFGFISPARDPADHLFFHIKEVHSARRPEVDDLVTFSLERQPDGKMRCVEVSYTNERPRDLPFPYFQVVALVFCLAAAASVGWRTEIQWLPLGYLGMGLLSYSLYSSDKTRAERREWRISEATLHWVDFLGGWPGGFIAQRVLRHKTSKGDFQLISQAIIAVHVVLWTAALAISARGLS